MVEKAKEENISLNQFVLYQLSRGVGYKEGIIRTRNDFGGT
ncbi:MAG: hypothetical protein ACYCVD_14895 [Desulfitobacteriaceae bacterium]